MHVSEFSAKSILTPQPRGLLASIPYPFTHSLSPYTGCSFGNTTCGLYCYAQFLPNWIHSSNGAPWGSAVRVKENAPELLRATLQSMSSEKRRRLRIFMASTTDPYQPIEARYRMTRQCLEVFAQYDDLDLLLVQTRGPLVTRDLDLLQSISYAWLSMTIETDDQQLLQQLRGGPPVRKRLEAIGIAAERHINTQIAIAPCLAYTPDFADRLLESGARRFVIDTFVEGDGSRGARTGASPIADVYPGWRDRALALALHERLASRGAEVGWSASGFCSIPPRSLQLPLLQ